MASNPVWTHSWIFICYPFLRPCKCKFAHEKIWNWFSFFGTYSMLSILHWDLCHSFNIALWTYLTGLPLCEQPFMNLHSLSTLFKGLTSLKLLMKRFGVDYHLFWDLFCIINFTLGPIPQFHYFIVNLFHSPNNNLWPAAQFFLNDSSNLEKANRLQLVQVNGFSVQRILWWVLKQLLCIWDL